jgi:uncharacterized membrane protein
MNEDHRPTQALPPFRVVLTPYRSLPPQGFVLLMVAVGLVSFVAGLVFLLMGAWPVFGFFGLDVLIIYVAFKLNYRSGRLYETVEIDGARMTLMRFHPSGEAERFDFNPLWARLRLTVGVDGRTGLAIASHGRELPFAAFLTDDERRDLATALDRALADVRCARL